MNDSQTLPRAAGPAPSPGPADAPRPEDHGPLPATTPIPRPGSGIRASLAVLLVLAAGGVVFWFLFRPAAVRDSLFDRMIHRLLPEEGPLVLLMVGVALILILALHLFRLHHQLLARDVLANDLLRHRQELDHAMRERTRDLKQANDSLAKSQAMLQLVMNHIPQRLYWKDRRSTYLGCDQSFATDVGLAAPENIVGRQDSDLPWPGDVAHQRQDRDREVMDRNQPRLKTLESHIDVHGQLRWLEVNRIPLHDEDGAVVGMLGTCEDITSRKLTLDLLEKRRLEIEQLNATLEERVRQEVEKNRRMDLMLVQQSRLAAMGEMIGNIAHQWRQPINSLNLILANLESAHAYGELTAEMMTDKVAAGQKIIMKMSSTIDDFRNFFKPDKRQTTFDPNQVIQEALSLVEASFKAHHIQASFEPLDPPVAVFGFPNEFSQVVLLILTNAKDAVAEHHTPKGRIQVKTVVEGGMLVTSVRDNGGGIPPEVIHRIFDPYFTTKGPQQGTGIGLYMAKMIIENHMQGWIAAESLEQGAEFRIAIPHHGPSVGTGEGEEE
ncbi:MAG: PAS domain-containing protein [Magnetococcales bacterium]|nr:PAS domain-containing protein [Magnetococcales bacterium]